MAAMRYTRYRAAAGFSLIEMMVAMAIGVVILLAVSEVFINNSRTRTEIENTSRQIENGRYAMQLLESELANAGFFGEAEGQAFPTTPTRRCPRTEDHLRDAMGVPVYGQNNISSSSAPACVSNYKSGNGFVAIRRSSTCAVGSPDCDTFKTNHFYAQVSACATSNPGQVLVKNTQSALAAMTRKCVASVKAPIYQFLSRLYYINSSDTLSVAELGVPASTAAASYSVTPLVDGIERLQFQYGLDSSGDGEVDVFKSALADGEWDDVVAVRIWLVARNLEATPGYTDDRSYVLAGQTYKPGGSFKRQLYTSTVRLNNLAGRRETP